MACYSIKNEKLKIVVITSGSSIGDSAFEYCEGLTSVTIGVGVTSIGDSAFDYCGLTSVYYTGTVDQWVQIDFKNATSNPLVYAEKLYINNQLLTEAKITTATKISSYAFNDCNSLLGVTISDSVTSIGNSAFEYCSSLTSVTIPDSVTSIGEYAFRSCSSLTYNTKDNLRYLGNSNNPYLCLIGASSKDITEATIDESCRFIGDSAFEYCEGLTSITIPDGVTSIGHCAFEYCSNLTSVTIPDSITSIGVNAFRSYSSLNYNIKDNLKYLGNDNNPYLCLIGTTSKDITEATIDENCRLIVYDAFSDCRSLLGVIIPNSVTSIGYSAFNNCVGLSSVYYKDTETEWNTISIDYSYGWNIYLAGATKFFYSETEPKLNSDGIAYDGNYWHYDSSGNIVVW